ncbi:MAG: hypothetical protein ACYDD1_14765 [Caulobacteraceae bacterium]
MKTLPLLAAAASALLAFAPLGAAFAQDAAPPPAGVASASGDWTLKQREDWLDSRIDKARDDKSIDHHEADRVHHELDSIKHDEHGFRDRHDGGQLTDNETQELEARLDQLAATVHWLHENSFQRPW